MFNSLFYSFIQKPTRIAVTCIVTSLISFGTTASDVATTHTTPPASIAKAGEAFNAELIKSTLEAMLGIKVDKVLKTPMPGIALVINSEGLLYASYDGEFVIQGNVYQINDGITDLADTSLAALRIDGVKKFANDMIVYPAKNEKHVVTVFTDITCGYCRKLHAQIDEYNALGITVQYLAYPRSGLSRNGQITKGYQDLQSIWCNANPAKAMTQAKSGANVATLTCDNAVAEEFAFGQQIGVSGTPAIILDDGSLLSGYRPPADLAQLLNNR